MKEIKHNKKEDFNKEIEDEAVKRIYEKLQMPCTNKTVTTIVARATADQD